MANQALCSDFGRWPTVIFMPVSIQRPLCIEVLIGEIDSSYVLILHAGCVAS